MAFRPAFITLTNVSNDKFVDKKDFEFKWFAGFAKSQKQKSISSLHEEILKKFNNAKILEVSSKSKEDLGVMLSAFNLTITHKDSGRRFTVESAFQSSKVFEKGGPYKDILMMNSRDAKRDPRLKNSGKLMSFEFFNTTWKLEPKTLFYDWLYINALSKHTDLATEVIKYNIFTDIEFNPQKSINCQAHAVALYVSLFKQNLLEEALISPDNYIKIITKSYIEEKTIFNKQFSFDKLK